MTLKGVPAFTVIALVGLGVQVEAQTPCPELMRLRNAATEAWKQAMRAPSSERCGALYHASLAADATRNYTDNNREACGISVALLNQVEGYHRQAVQARDNARDRRRHQQGTVVGSREHQLERVTQVLKRGIRRDGTQISLRCVTTPYL